MQIETLQDVLHWARESHRCLKACAQHCSSEAETERVALLLCYLSDHEERLVAALEVFEDEASLNALNTWCSEYIQKKAVVLHEQCDDSLAKQSVGEIVQRVVQQHQAIIDLYDHLHDRLPVGQAADFIAGLRNLEMHESMQIVKHAQQLQDL